MTKHTESNGEFVHNNKTHRSTAEAFRGADYAQWLEKDPEVADMKLFIKEFVFIGLPMVVVGIAVVCLILKYVG
jgi:hypothetical protein